MTDLAKHVLGLSAGATALNLVLESGPEADSALRWLHQPAGSDCRTKFSDVDDESFLHDGKGQPIEEVGLWDVNYATSGKSGGIRWPDGSVC